MSSIDKFHGPCEERLAEIKRQRDDLLTACRAAQRYFQAIGAAWDANDGKLVDLDGRPVIEADGLNELCDLAEELTRAAIAGVEPQICDECRKNLEPQKKRTE